MAGRKRMVKMEGIKIEVKQLLFFFLFFFMEKERNIQLKVQRCSAINEFTKGQLLNTKLVTTHIISDQIRSNLSILQLYFRPTFFQSSVGLLLNSDQHLASNRKSFLFSFEILICLYKTLRATLLDFNRRSQKNLKK